MSSRMDKDMQQRSASNEDEAAMAAARARMEAWEREQRGDDEDDDDEVARDPNAVDLDNHDFTELCEHLSWDDPFATRVSDGNLSWTCWYGMGTPLGEALRDNTHVAQLEIDTTIVCSAQRVIDRREIQGLLAFVRQSKSLRTFHLSANGWSDVLDTLSLWTEALAQNQHVQEFVLHPNDDFVLPSDTMSRFFQTAKSLKRLILPLSSDRYDDGGMCLQGLTTMQGLEGLAFYQIDVSQPHECAARIQNLPCPPHLKSVGLSFGFSPYSRPIMVISRAIAAFIRSSPASLTELTLSHFFDEEGMVCFLDALYTRNSITKLVLDYCFFAAGAAEAFAAYMREKNGLVGSSFIQGGITSLTIACFGFPFGLLPPMMAGPRGSGLESLVLDSTASQFLLRDFDTFVACQSPRLRTLKVTVSGAQERDMITRHLPSLVYLKELVLSFPFVQRNYTAALVRAMYQNGSLHTMIARGRSVLSATDVLLFSDDEARLVEAIGQRNRHASQLVQSLGEDSDEGTNDNLDRESGTSLAAVPPLCLVVQQTPRMALHHVFKGVKALNGSFGSPRRSTIRKRPVDWDDHECTPSSTKH